jgi:hypothetical protein
MRHFTTHNNELKNPPKKVELSLAYGDSIVGILIPD